MDLSSTPFWKHFPRHFKPPKHAPGTRIDAAIKCRLGGGEAHPCVPVSPREVVSEPFSHQEANMAQPERYQDLVLGSGEGGKYLAWHLARSGRRTAVVERRYIGGSCPNINCLPSKNEIWSAKVADLVHHAAKFGMVTGPTAIDMGRVRQRKSEMVEGLVAMHLDLYRASGAELIMGSGRFVAPKTLEVRLNDGGTRLLAGDRVFLNVGFLARMPP